MANIDIFSLEPHKVSRSLRGYSVFFYGEAKSGKTTTASKFPDSLILGFEKGWNALPGVMAMPINSWAEFKKVLRQLKDPRAKEKYSTIIIDTADIAYDYVTKYICDNAPRTKEQGGGYGVDSISDIPFGKGYAMVAQEFDECLRSIVKMDYGLVLISHSTDKTFTDENGVEYNKIVPTLDKRATNIVSRMADIIGYSRAIEDKEGNTSTKLFIRGTARYMAGSRFKYTPNYIDFSYKNLVNAIGDAIDKQAEEDGKEFFTDENSNLHMETVEPLDFDELMSEFNNIINSLGENNDEETFESYYKPRIIQITDRQLGRGVKASSLSREQTEALSLVIDDLKELANSKP